MSRPAPLPAADDDPANAQAAASAFDLLLLELVPLAQRISEQVLAREQALLDEYRKSRLFNRTAPKAPAKTHGEGKERAETGVSPEKRDGGEKQEEGDGVGMTTLGFPVMGGRCRERVHWRLDNMGYRVGQGMVERFSVNKPRPITQLDAIKFICKDLWLLVFRKQIDNLKTNHRGIFVLTDHRFQPLSKMSPDRRTGAKGVEDAVERAGLYLFFPAGVIRGALQGFGLECTVEGTVTEIPSATFQIKMKGAKA